MVLPVLAQSRPGTRPIVGAIRWDAWSGGRITEEVERTLGPRKYHDRLPWFAQVKADGQVRIDGSAPGIMEREIKYAAEAGLDYWAFLLYPEASEMSRALGQYLKSPERGKIGFCVILHNALGVPEAQWPRERDRAVALLREPGYQKVLDGRPLVFEFQSRFNGQFPRQRFDDFRAAARKAGINPYCVYMGWNPGPDHARMATHGFDAVSAYARPTETLRAFADLAQDAERSYWHDAARAKVPCIPLVTTGWDKQPRKDNPVSWEKDHAYHRQAGFPAAAQPDEIAAHFKRAVEFVSQHPQICPANAIVIYAWNEHDEGGWLAPTWRQDGNPDTSRLNALRRAIGRTP